MSEAPTDDTEISVRGLTKRFGSQVVLEDITCDIPKGKITLMLGPSGTGKSVFLKNVMGLLKPERGEIWIDGKNLPTLKSRELYKIRRKFGVLFQDGALFGSMSIYDNVAFPLREHTKKGEKEIREIVNEKLKMVGLTGAEKKLPGEISGGMKKRAGLARALVLDPEIMMFDEPDSGLDPVRTAFLNELILDLNRQLGPTMIVVTHDIATARRVADYIGMLYLRNLVKFDTARSMFESDIPVVRQFLAGATEGPIGMSEESDQGRKGNAEDIQAVSTSGLTAEETDELERQAGAPDDGGGESRSQRRFHSIPAVGNDEDGREAPLDELFDENDEAPGKAEWDARIVPRQDSDPSDRAARGQDGLPRRRPRRRRPITASDQEPDDPNGDTGPEELPRAEEGGR